MAVNDAHSPAGTSFTPRSQAWLRSGESARSADESPDLLRWRADLLMDEMMLGAVDLSTGGLGVRHHEQPANARRPAVSVYSDSFHSAAAFDSPESPAAEDWWRTPERFEPGGRDDRGGETVRVASAGTAQPAQAEGAALRPPSAAARAAEGGRAAHVAAREAPSERSAFTKVRSNLLPRTSTADARTLQQEMAAMQEEIVGVLPEDHEWSARSRHLLDKARTLLRSDPDRTAEVEYYIQQVRSLLERSRQMRGWSQLYHRHLRTYLLGWLLLSAVVLSALLLYGAPFATTVTAALRLPEEGLAALHLVPLLAALFAATLGASLATLSQIRRRTTQHHGFFDRKFSLRGLLLPPMALLAALLIYLLVGLVWVFAGLNPMQNVAIGLVPAVLAFLYGLLQEKIYGTAD